MDQVTRSAAPFYPVFLDLRDRACLVVGAGPIAVGKVQGLIDAGARVTVVAPTATEEIQRWHAAGQLEWIPRAFRDEDVGASVLVIAATADRELNAAVFQSADRARVVANAVDDLDHCNFIAPAVARVGSLQVAVSTAGRSPALAKVIRDRILRDHLSVPLAELADCLGTWRPAVKQTLEGYARRQTFWENVLDSCVPRLVQEGDLSRAHRAIGECLRRAGDGDETTTTCAAEASQPATCRACRGGRV